MSAPGFALWYTASVIASNISSAPNISSCILIQICHIILETPHCLFATSYAYPILGKICSI